MQTHEWSFPFSSSSSISFCVRLGCVASDRFLWKAVAQKFPSTFPEQKFPIKYITAQITFVNGLFVISTNAGSISAKMLRTDGFYVTLSNNFICKYCMCYMCIFQQSCMEYTDQLSSSLFSLWSVQFSWPFSSLYAMLCLSWGKLKRNNNKILSPKLQSGFLVFAFRTFFVMFAHESTWTEYYCKFPYKARAHTQKAAENKEFGSFSPPIICENLFLCATKNVFSCAQTSGILVHSNFKFWFSLFNVYRERACICSTKAPKYFLFLLLLSL